MGASPPMEAAVGPDPCPGERTTTGHSPVDVHLQEYRGHGSPGGDTGPSRRKAPAQVGTWTGECRCTAGRWGESVWKSLDDVFLAGEAPGADSEVPSGPLTVAVRLLSLQAQPAIRRG